MVWFAGLRARPPECGGEAFAANAELDQFGIGSFRVAQHGVNDLVGDAANGFAVLDAGPWNVAQQRVHDALESSAGGIRQRVPEPRCTALRDIPRFASGTLQGLADPAENTSIGESGQCVAHRADAPAFGKRVHTVDIARANRAGPFRPHDGFATAYRSEVRVTAGCVSGLDTAGREPFRMKWVQRRCTKCFRNFIPDPADPIVVHGVDHESYRFFGNAFDLIPGRFDSGHIATE